MLVGVGVLSPEGRTKGVHGGQGARVAAAKRDAEMQGNTEEKRGSSRFSLQLPRNGEANALAKEVLAVVDLQSRSYQNGNAREFVQTKSAAAADLAAL